MKYYLKTTEEMGRGLYSHFDIETNKILFQAEILVLNEPDTLKVNETDLKDYTFHFNEKQDCIVLGDGEIFNHSETPNIAYKLMDHENRKVMVFYAIRPIKADEQLFIDYNADTKALNVKNNAKYNVNLI